MAPGHLLLVVVMTFLINVFHCSGMHIDSMRRRFIFQSNPSNLCPPIPTVSHGSLKCTSNNMLNSQCKLTCFGSYRPVHSVINCVYHVELKKSTWTYTPACEAKSVAQCGDPPVISHGRYRCYSSAFNYVGNTCTLTCDPGYKYSNNRNSIICQTGGVWSQSASCVVDTSSTCGSPPSIPNGGYTCPSSTHTIGHECNYSCHYGYTLSDLSNRITCQSGGKWSTLVASCAEKQCPSPPRPNNGYYHCSPSTVHVHGQVCSLTCNSGYIASTSRSSITCGADSKWSTPASCLAKQCPSPPRPNNGYYHCSPSTVHVHGQVCSLTCNSGYIASTSRSSITCGADSKWSTPASCLEIRCPKPYTPLHASYHCSSNSIYRPGTTCTLTCSAGYTPSRSHTTITCTSQSTWTESVSCHEIVCPAPAPVTNGRYHCPSSTDVYKVNDVCYLQCSYGYQASSNPPEVHCLSTGNWSKSLTCSEIRCPDPPRITNGLYTCASDKDHPLNEVCHLQCDHGFKPITSTSDIQCQLTNTWSTPATCIEKMCDSPPKVENGTYHCNSTTYTTSTSCSLQCDHGYKAGPGSSTIYCQEEETWSLVTSCIKI